MQQLQKADHSSLAAARWTLSCLGNSHLAGLGGTSLSACWLVHHRWWYQSIQACLSWERLTVHIASLCYNLLWTLQSLHESTTVTPSYCIWSLPSYRKIKTPHAHNTHISKWFTQNICMWIMHFTWADWRQVWSCLRKMHIINILQNQQKQFIP